MALVPIWPFNSGGSDSGCSGNSSSSALWPELPPEEALPHGQPRVQAILYSKPMGVKLQWMVSGRGQRLHRRAEALRAGGGQR